MRLRFQKREGRFNDRVLSEVSREPQIQNAPPVTMKNGRPAITRQLRRVRHHDVQDREGFLISWTRGSNCGVVGDRSVRLTRQKGCQDSHETFLV